MNQAGRLLSSVVALVALAVVVGCAGSEPTAIATTARKSSAEPTKAFTSEPTVEPTTPTPLKVSLEAVCFELDKAPFEAVQIVSQVVKDPTLDSIDHDKVTDLADTFEHLSAVAPAELTTALEEQASTLRQIQRIMETQIDETINFENFKSANIDIVLRCGDAAGS